MKRTAVVQISAELEEKIRTLERELYMARLNIVGLAPENFQALLNSYRDCKSRSETYQWLNLIAEKIGEQAGPILGAVRADIFGERAFCPLCRGGSDTLNSFEAGYKLPEGLRRHLVGYGRSHFCPVTEAAMNMARENWNSSFSEVEEAHAAQSDALRRARSLTEALYVIGPTGEALLAEGNIFEKPRGDDDEQFGMKWAEQRLFSLGFQIGVAGREKSYTKSSVVKGKPLTVYADPRFQKSIQFRVFDGDAKGKKRGLALHTFHIPDAWKNNLGPKIEAAIFGSQYHGMEI